MTSLIYDKGGNFFEFVNPLPSVLSEDFLYFPVLEDSEFNLQNGTHDFLKILNFITKNKFNLKHIEGQTTVLRNTSKPYVFIAQVYAPFVQREIRLEKTGAENALTALLKEVILVHNGMG